MTAAARDDLGRHLEHEETRALVLRHLTQQDWHRMEQEHFTGRRMPLATTLFLVPWVCDGVPEPVRRRAFAEAGRVFLWSSTGSAVRGTGGSRAGRSRTPDAAL